MYVRNIFIITIFFFCIIFQSEYMVLEPPVCKIEFMYLRAIFCIFQISGDFYYIPVGGRGGERGSAGEGEGARERGIGCILYGYT
jgi:hypothetical protein